VETRQSRTRCETSRLADAGNRDQRNIDSITRSTEVKRIALADAVAESNNERGDLGACGEVYGCGAGDYTSEKAAWLEGIFCCTEALRECTKAEVSCNRES